MQEYLNESVSDLMGMLVELIEKGCTDEDMKWPFIRELDDNAGDGLESGAKMALDNFIVKDDADGVYGRQSTKPIGYRLAVRIMEIYMDELPKVDSAYTWQHMIDHMRQYAMPDCPEED